MRADHCLKYPKHTEERKHKTGISGITKFSKQQDRQDARSNHYMGGYSHFEFLINTEILSD